MAVLEVGLALGTWPGAAVALFMVLAGCAHRIGVEERALLENLGEEYAAYRRRTKRLVPWIY